MIGKNVQLDKCRAAAVMSSLLPLEMEKKAEVFVCTGVMLHTEAVTGV